MIRRLNAHLDRVYRDVDLLRKQKVKALAWVCLVFLASMSLVMVEDLVVGERPATFYLQSIGLPMSLIGLAFVLVVTGLMGRHFDWILLAIATIHVISSLQVGDSPQIFYCGFSLYSACVLLAAAAFARRWMFAFATVLELGLTAVYGQVFLVPGRSPLEDYFRLTQLDSFVSLLVVASLAWAFVAMVDRTFDHLRLEIDKNDHLRAGLERKVASRTAELETAREAALSSSLAKSAFLADMSHEIRTPLNGILGMVELLRDTGLTREQQEKVEILVESGNHLLGLVQDILDHSKIEAGRIELTLESIPLAPFLRAVVDPLRGLADSRSLSLEWEATADLPTAISADPLRLRQILTNLLGNALKFTERGEVRLSVRKVDHDRIEFAVRDTGIGMDAEALNRIFHRFSQAEESTSRRFGGTGLGLAISKGLAQAMDGDLSADSEPGKGSVFRVNLPLTPALLEVFQGQPKAGESTVDLRIRMARVLVVEDNRINRKVAEGLLTRNGCAVELCVNGRDALDLLARELFDLVLMDCQMPVMDGYQASRAIRAWHDDPDPIRQAASQVPIVALTARSSEDAREECLEHGMDDVLSKPLDANSLRDALSKWVGNRKA